jgi:hypothetical protein
MIRSLVALTAGAGVFALTGAAAATLGVTGFVPQSEGISAACMTGTVTTKIAVSSPSATVSNVQVSGIGASCKDEPLYVILRDSDQGQLAMMTASPMKDKVSFIKTPSEGTFFAGTDFSGPVSAIDVASIDVVIAGQIVS